MKNIKWVNLVLAIVLVLSISVGAMAEQNVAVPELEPELSLEALTAEVQVDGEAQDLEEIPAPEMLEAIEENPAPETQEAAEETSAPVDGEMTKETPAPETEKAVEVIPAPVSEETPAPETEEAVEETPAPVVEETTEETPVPENKEAVEETPALAIEEATEEAPVPETEKAVEETPVPVTEETTEEPPTPEAEEEPVVTPAPETEEVEATPETEEDTFDISEETVKQENGELLPILYTIRLEKRADVRLMPDGMSTLIAHFSEGSLMPVVEELKDWYKVKIDRTIDGIYYDYGYVYRWDVDVAPAEAPKSVQIFTSARQSMVLGETIHLSSVLTGFDDDTLVTYQWQYDRGAGWENVPGATGASYSFPCTVENMACSWRLVVEF